MPVKTPYLDRLKKQAITFSKAYRSEGGDIRAKFRKSVPTK